MATAAHAKKVYAKSASGAPGSGDEIDGVMDCTVSESRTAIESTDYKGDQFRTRLMGLRDVSISMSGQMELSDSPQNLIRSSYASGATIYITVLDDGTNGFTFPCLVESYEKGGGVDDAATFSASFVLNGAPVAVP